MPIPALFGYNLENDNDFTGVKQIASEFHFRLRAKGYATQNYPQIAFDVLPDLRRGRLVLLKPELFVEASDNL